MAGKLTIVLPYPFRELNPNYKCHWRVKHEYTQLAKDMGFSRAFGRDFSPTGKIRAEWTFHPPDRRRRDEDNMVASMKPYQDGVCLALGFDDRLIVETKREVGAPISMGSVELVLIDLERSKP